MAAPKYEAVLGSAEKKSELKSWIRGGLSDVEIARKLGVTPVTLCRWKGKYPELKLLYDELTIDHVLEVEAALLRICLGTVVKEESIAPNGDKWVKTKEIPPNAQACIQWLKAKSPAWQRALSVTIVPATEGENPLAGMTDKELEKLIRSAEAGQ